MTATSSAVYVDKFSDDSMDLFFVLQITMVCRLHWCHWTATPNIQIVPGYAILISNIVVIRQLVT